MSQPSRDALAGYAMPPASRGDVTRVDQLQDAGGGAYITTQTATYKGPFFLPWRVTDGDGHVTDTAYDSTWRYPAAVGRVVSDTLTLTTTYQYDPTFGLGRLYKEQTGPTSNPTALQNLRYFYDRVGNVTRTEDCAFTGQKADGSGLLFYGARWYDPVAARWTQPDTIVPSPGDPQSLNRYSYVNNR